MNGQMSKHRCDLEERSEMNERGRKMRISRDTPADCNQLELNIYAVVCSSYFVRLYMLF